MLPRLCLAAEKIQYLKYPFYNYVLRDGSIMRSANSEKKRMDSLNIYSEWHQIFDSIEDSELQRYLYGALAEYYVRNCRAHKIKGWKINGLDFKFAWKYSLNAKERLKAVAFTVLPELYIKLWKEFYMTVYLILYLAIIVFWLFTCNQYRGSFIEKTFLLLSSMSMALIVGILRLFLRTMEARTVAHRCAISIRNRAAESGLFIKRMVDFQMQEMRFDSLYILLLCKNSSIIIKAYWFWHPLY